MKTFGIALLVSLSFAGNLYASETGAAPEANHCIGSGPQSPRDIDNTVGENSVKFSKAPDTDEMNMCNIHYHRNAEHKAAAYSLFVEDEHGSHSGWACKEPAADRKEIGELGFAAGDTVEVHWVYTTCNINAEGAVPMGTGLNACLTTTCANPQLKVVAQIFVAEEGGEVTSMAAPMAHEDQTVVYNGSTTGPTYNNDHCSAMQVTWDVKETCDTLNLETLVNWSEENHEHAHGVRDLVTDAKLLSKIKNKD